MTFNANRRMQALDWTTWAALKSIIEAIPRTQSSNFEIIRTCLQSDQINLDV
jgi:hypothetical protein